MKCTSCKKLYDSTKICYNRYNRCNTSYYSKSCKENDIHVHRYDYLYKSENVNKASCFKCNKKKQKF